MKKKSVLSMLCLALLLCPSFAPAAGETGASIVDAAHRGAYILAQAEADDPQLTTFSGIVTYRSGKHVYLQSGDRAFLALLDSDNEAADMSAVQKGKRVTVTGSATTFQQGAYHIPEIVDAMIGSVTDGDKTITPASVTIAQLNDGHMARLVQVKDTKQNLAAAELQLSLGEYADEQYLTVTGVLSANADGRVLLGASIQAGHLHQAGAATRENEVKATCTEGGSYDEVVYCSDCGEELSRTHKTVNALGHSPKTAVQENVVPATATQEGSYDEVVYCERCGKELSREKKTLGKAVKGLTITEEPQSATVLNGKKASFTVKTSGTGVSYQWYCRKSAKAKWTKIKKATKATYTVTAKPTNNGYQYKCVVKNASGSLTTNIVTLKVDRHPPVITGQPKSVTADSGTNAVFTVSAQNGKTYQWYYRKGTKGKWKKVKGGTRAALSVAVTSAKNGCQYKCVVKNGDGSVTTDVVKLTVNVHLPVITKQPASVTAGSGTNATFTVSTQYGKSYQWYYRKGAKGKWKKVKKGTKATLSVAATASKNGYQYKCVVKNGDGSVTTSVVKLTVK